MADANRAQGAGSEGITVLRKYANRRLYDTSRARCVTLADVAARVQGGERVRIVDAKSGDDVTRVVLAHILCERETTTEGLLDAAVLSRLIRLAATADALQVSDAIAAALDGLAFQHRTDTT